MRTAYTTTSSSIAVAARIARCNYQRGPGKVVIPRLEKACVLEMRSMLKRTAPGLLIAGTAF